MPEIMTLDELAEYLKLPQSAVYSMTRARGKARARHPLPVLRLGTKSLRFRREDILKWLDQCAKETDQ